MKNKHLSLDDRITIEKLLEQGKNFTYIANELECNQTTISREIKSHYITKQSGTYGRKFNNCVLRDTCAVKHTCPLSNCSEYKKEECNLLCKAPYVCNGCKSKYKCTLEKRLYSASIAQSEYQDNLKETRLGTIYSKRELQELENILKPLIVEQHQSIHHAYINNKDKMICSEKEIYNLIDIRAIDIMNLDLPRKVRYKKRKNDENHHKVDMECRINRTYDDFKKYLELNPDMPIVEIDSVEGIKGGKVLLTIFFRTSSFMLAYMRDRNDSQSVIDVFNKIQNKIGLDKFKELFPIILTDNGTEFSNPIKIEFDDQGNQRTKIFYCDPSAPNQKGGCEVTHEFIRRIIQKGESFDEYNQTDINIMMSHINSYTREKLNNKKPITMFNFIYGDNTTSLFDIQEIESNKVTLSKTIFKNS